MTPRPLSAALRLCLPALLPAFASLLLAACGKPAAPAVPPATPVLVQTLKPQPAAVTIDYVAKTEAASAVEIRPRVAGLLDRQVVTEGAAVQAGDLLFVIDPQPYEAAVAERRAALALAQSAFDQAAQDLARVQPLLALDAISQQEVDAVIARHSAADAQIAAARAALRTAELELSYTRVVAPIAGRVGRVGLRVGGLASAQTTLLTTLYSTDPMHVNFAISEARLLDVQRELGRALDQSNPGRRKFTVLLGDGSVYPHPGELNFVDAAVDDRTGTLGIRLAVPNPDGLLRANQFARVRVTVREVADALVVPGRAVQAFQGKDYVWIVDAGGLAQQRDVRLGARVAAGVILDDGVQAGDRVVVDGMQKLKAGSPVAAHELEPADAAAAATDAGKGQGQPTGTGAAP